jgi:hypothetical protein
MGGASGTCFATSLLGMSSGEKRAPKIIEIDLQDLRQLFNSMDPTPFPGKDLDQDAEEFLVSWAKEFPESTPLKLVVHLHQWPADAAPGRIVKDAIHHYFNYRADLSRREFRQLMRRGRTSLLVGLAFLASCLFLSGLLNHVPGALALIAKEGLMIGGWVAMWRPLEILLYDWWPLRRSRRILEKLAAMDIVVDAESTKPAGAGAGRSGADCTPRVVTKTLSARRDEYENQYRTHARNRQSSYRRNRAGTR